MEAVGGATINESVAKKERCGTSRTSLFLCITNDPSVDLEKPGHQIVPNDPGPKPGIYPIQCTAVSGNHFS